MNLSISSQLLAIVTLAGLVSLTFLASCGTPVTGVPFHAEKPTFPTVSGDNLNNRTFDIPAGLDAPYNILLVAFLQEQQEAVNTWLPTAKSIVADHANVEYYELPTISSGWGLVRGFVDGGMRSGIPAFADRERTITVYTDTKKFRELAGIDDPKQIWVGLVDREGRVYWSSRGKASEDTLKELQAQVRALASPTAPVPGPAPK